MSGRVAFVALALAFSAACMSNARAANWPGKNFWMSGHRRVEALGQATAHWLEKNFWMSGPNYNRRIPACDDAPALDEIKSRFAIKEARFWNSALGIVDIEDVRQTAYLPWAAQSMPRRFCTGIAVISDGRRRPVYYSIASGTNMIGMGWGVSFCVVGFDRSWAYGPDCRAAKP